MFVGSTYLEIFDNFVASSDMTGNGANMAPAPSDKATEKREARLAKKALLRTQAAAAKTAGDEALAERNALAAGLNKKRGKPQSVGKILEEDAAAVDAATAAAATIAADKAAKAKAEAAKAKAEAAKAKAEAAKAMRQEPLVTFEMTKPDRFTVNRQISGKPTSVARVELCESIEGGDQTIVFGRAATRAPRVVAFMQKFGNHYFLTEHYTVYCVDSKDVQMEEFHTFLSGLRNFSSALVGQFH